MDPIQTTWLTDEDDMTCNSDPNLKSITVAWDIEYPLTWIRMVLNNNEMFSTVRIIYFTANGDTECNNLTWAYLNQTTMDIRCEDYVKTQNITFIGNIVSLCSLYISG
uniref:Uncharacterized protein n=1 Tax=Biomphalaria glabrata TaxID=6526 RepID=A0A2C9KQ72_BIOGL